MSSDKKKIIIGLSAFILVITLPFWSNLGKVIEAPKLELTEKAKISKNCVLPNDSMKLEHMHLLDLWRHSVVRNGKRVFVNYKNLEYEMSISNTCLDCHSNKSSFCDRCHNYASVEPYCWDCHIDDPKGDKK